MFLIMVNKMSVSGSLVGSGKFIVKVHPEKNQKKLDGKECEIIEFHITYRRVFLIAFFFRGAF